MNQCYDLHVRLNGGLNDLEGRVKLAEQLGWDGICLTADFQDIKTLKVFSDRISDMRKETVMDLFSGAEITGKSAQGFQKDSRKALDYVDLILVRGGGDEVNRSAAECWEVDLLCHPEKLAEKDFMKQRNSGIDHVMAKFMAERLIGMEFNLTEILNSYGMLRSQVLGRMHQNVVLARKYSVSMILTSGGQGNWELRAPRDLISIGNILGMTPGEAKEAVSENPSKILRKSGDRKNPNILLKGLDVVEWGDQKQRGKRAYGWY
jgi:ribonuclease P/MRP protein subunit RPP1